MTSKEYNAITTAIWRSCFIKDKNRVRQAAKEQTAKSIAIGVAAELKQYNPDIDVDKFVKDCYL
jgi:hypothetical protein